MKVAILGAGFTGLTAALRLLQHGHNVTIFEKEPFVGGLAVGFRKNSWQWPVEKTYHHWFTNDACALDLARELSTNILIKRPSTDVYINGKQLPLDSPLNLLMFPHLSVVDRLRTGISLLFLKLVNDYRRFNDKTAVTWIEKFMGRTSFQMIWDPLFTGKFGEYKNDIALTWFWARIKKRTSSLAYPEGGFGSFADKIASEIKRLGGKIYLGTAIDKIRNNGKNIIIRDSKYDKVIVTLPTPIFVKITSTLPKNYIEKVSSTSYLHALNLLLVLNKPFMKRTYWLNITDNTFPFLVLVEHTNFISPKYYGGQHIVYVGSYLPREHRYFKMTKKELLKEFTPFLKKINPNFQFSILNSQLFVGLFAQPIVTVDYEKKMPSMKAPIKNVYLANLSMVYPWDRGTNYAIELGEKVAKLIMES